MSIRVLRYENTAAAIQPVMIAGNILRKGIIPCLQRKQAQIIAAGRKNSRLISRAVGESTPSTRVSHKISRLPPPIPNRLPKATCISISVSVSVVAAKSIGENCWINQQVTIGYGKGEEPPVIGNDVMITCGAKVLGRITVGDGAVIGANAVVIRDVEPGAVMGGVPAKRIR